MTAPDDTKIQVNYGATGPLVNFYASDPQELEQLMHGYAEVATIVEETQNLYNALRALGPLTRGSQSSPGSSGPENAAQGRSGASLDTATPPAGATRPSCPHGEMYYDEFTSTAGNFIKMWKCPAKERDCKGKFLPRGR